MDTTTSQVSYAPSARTATGTPTLRVLDGRLASVRQLRRVGFFVFGVQLVVLLVWSVVEAYHRVQGADFVGFYQSWYLIAHGVLNPDHWWQAQGIFIQYPLALLALIWPHPVTLLVVQDFAIVGAEVVAYLWICDLVAASDRSLLWPYCLTGLALLALNPWIYWSASWDYHSEPLGTLFAVLAARELFRGRRIGFLWGGITILCGMVPATYVAGIGVSLVIRQRRRIAGYALLVASAVWFLLLTGLGAGTTLGYATEKAVSTKQATPASLGTITTRLSTLAHMLLHHWVDLFANLAPSGLIGLFTAPVLGVAGITLGENFSQGNPNSIVPSFQGIPVYIFVPVGTVAALIWLRRRVGPRFAAWFSAALVINVVGWAVVWIPKVVPNWLLVTSPEASALKHVQSMIPAGDGVVASQGIAGDLANHSFIKMFFGTPARLPIKSPYTWFVIAPYAGVETATVEQSAQLIAALAQNPDAELKYVSQGIWAFRLHVTPRQAHKDLYVAGKRARLSAALFSTGGNAVRRGPMRDWYVTGNKTADGPVLWGDYFLESVGKYAASVTLAGHGAVADVQVWNDTTNTLLSSRTSVVRGRLRVTLPAAVSRSDPKRAAVAQSGSALFQIDPVGALFGNNLEIRVFAGSPRALRIDAVSMRLIARS